ncbi:MAG: SAM-dependent chlorinase/fluorinase [Acidobacteria bacterium]|nr:SAM-dependent chlorinase/fluorinase [Acidobacteriota bacterium]
MIITLLTDFGTQDYFVGAMKGVILSINPRATVVDITHEIPAHDIRAGAFTLRAAAETYPAGTVHVAVVDPGVGSERRAIIAECAGQFFVAPDNGLLSYACTRPTRVVNATNRKFFRESVSDTFHGRDIFAPAAAALSSGVAPAEFGEEVDDWVRLPAPAPRRSDDGTLEASVIHVDRFGNLVTDITRGDLADEEIARGATLTLNGRTISRFRHFFAEDSDDAPFAIWGSAGFLEIAAFQASAAEHLGARVGQSIQVNFVK